MLMPLLLACVPTWTTQGGWLSVQAPGLVDVGGAGAANRVMTGTTVTPSLSCASGCPEGTFDLDACWTQAVRGAISGDPATGPVTFEGEGSVTWTFTPQGCDATSLGYAPERDRLELVVVPASWARGRLAGAVEEALEDAVATGAARAEIPDGWVPALDEPWLLLEGQAASLFPRLLGSDGGDVAWQAEGATVLAAPADGVSALQADGAVTITMDPGTEATLSLELPAGSFYLGQIRAVAASEAASMTIVPAYGTNAEGGEAPLGARAVVLDAAGTPLFGAPVAWTVDGDLEVDAFVAGGDYVELVDCRPPSEGYGARTATLQASWNGLSASAALSWTARLEPGSDEAWTADPACPTEDTGVDDTGVDDTGDGADDSGAADDTGVGGGKGGEGCGCGAPAAPGAAGLLLAMGALARRRRTPTA